MKNGFKNAGLAIVMALGFSQLSNANVTLDCESGNRGIEQAACWGFVVTGYYNLATLLIPGKAVNIVRNNPGTPPNMILPDANTPANTPATSKVAAVEAVTNSTTEKFDINKYFSTNYLDLEEEFMELINIYSLLTTSRTENCALYPSINDWIGEKQNYQSFVKLAENKYSSPEMQEFIQKVNEARLNNGGPFLEGQIRPEWYIEKVELLVKKLVFFYASHSNLEDYGMDMDYLTFPSLENAIITDEKLLTLFDNQQPPVLRQLVQYDNLLSKYYNGVATVGKLGRVLNLKGVELYNLWKGLTEAGLVADFEWKKTGPSGEQVIYKSNKWLEIPGETDINKLVTKLVDDKTISEELKIPLANYLLTLQNGTKKNSLFISRYKLASTVYKNNALSEYLLSGYDVFTTLGSEDEATIGSQANIQKFINDIADELIKEYNKFEEEILEKVRIFQLNNKVNNFSDLEFLKPYLDRIQSEFEGELPLGQEFLFRVLQMIDNKVKEKSPL
jgi:hypothetical protein